MSGFKGHRPSGQSSWPVVLVAGAEKCGKSYLAAEFSSSDLVGQTYWIEFGENTAEHYGAVPGANYILADHDGTFNDVCQRAREAVAEPMVDGKPNVIVIDSVSMIWETLSAEAQQIANGRRKAGVDGEAKITSDVWNLVTARWSKLLRILKGHNGPVILIARLEVVSVMDANGQPTKDKTQKVKAQKALPFVVDVIVQIPEYRRFQLTGVRSLVLQMPPGQTFDVPSDFTLDALMRNMGLADAVLEPRQFVEPVASVGDALEEIGVAPPERPLERQQPRADDEWTRPAPDNAAELNQLSNIADGLRHVRGITEPEAMLTAVSAIVERKVTAPEQLNRDEANRVLAVLRAEDAAAKQVRRMHVLFHEAGVSDRTVRLERMSTILGRKLTTSAGLPPEDVQAVIKALEAHLAETPAAEPAAAEGLYVDVLAEQIRVCGSSDDLADLGDVAWRAHESGTLTQAELTRLMDLSMAREQELAVASRAAA